MKISPQQVQLITKLYRDQRQAGLRPPREDSRTSADKVTISRTSQEIQAAMARLADMPEVRECKVAELRAAIEGGTYQVSSREVAEKLLERILVDEILQDEI